MPTPTATAPANAGITMDTIQGRFFLAGGPTNGERA